MSRIVWSQDLVIFWHKCDICMNESYTIYIQQLDKWYCVNCIQIACNFLNNQPQLCSNNSG
jgi:hypothetical protein